MASEDSAASTCVPVRVRIRVYALCLWLVLSVPSICVTIVLNVFSEPTNHTVQNPANQVNPVLVKLD